MKQPKKWPFLVVTQHFVQDTDRLSSFPIDPIYYLNHSCKHSDDRKKIAAVFQFKV
jgi:hypothetical protein